MPCVFHSLRVCRSLHGRSLCVAASDTVLDPCLPPRSVCKNDITGDGAENLAKAVLEHPALTSFCEIPLASLRENSLEELDLSGKGVGVPGAIVLSSLLPSASALRSLKCAPPCTQSQSRQRPIASAEVAC